jgi:DNA-binding NarL/FixJ family response regulator
MGAAACRRVESQYRYTPALVAPAGACNTRCVTTPLRPPLDPPVRVVVVDDSWRWSEIATHPLQRAADFELVGTVAENEADAVRLIESERPHIALVDVMLPGGESGLAVARRVRNRQPDVRVVLISKNPPPGAVDEARTLGVAGFLHKDDLLSAEFYVARMRRVALGHTVYTPRILAASSSADTEPANQAAARFNLTTREHQVIACLAEGLAVPEVARRLSIDDQTVRNNITRIGRKLDVSGQLAILVRAMNEGIVPRPDRDI